MTVLCIRLEIFRRLCSRPPGTQPWVILLGLVSACSSDEVAPAAVATSGATHTTGTAEPSPTAAGVDVAASTGNTTTVASTAATAHGSLSATGGQSSAALSSGGGTSTSGSAGGGAGGTENGASGGETQTSGSLETSATAQNSSSGTTGAQDDGWVDLFNGVDLAGWVAHDGGRGDASSLPIEDVFQVVDGEIHVYRGATNGSPQVFGNLRSETEISGNYVLHVEYRWGSNKFAPRANADRDGGILFHITGRDVGKVFPDSLEMQIGDSQLGGDYMTGDLWVLGVPTVAHVMIDEELTPIGDVGGASVPHYASVHAENPHGEWNECEITVNGSEAAVFMLNGVEVHRVDDFSYDGQPLDRGFVSVQAEWAEIFYRNIRYRQL